jgi:hypothetical protein
MAMTIATPDSHVGQRAVVIAQVRYQRALPAKNLISQVRGLT